MWFLYVLSVLVGRGLCLDSENEFGLKSLGFGSCFATSHSGDGKIWEKVGGSNLTGWLWMGDSVYPPSPSLTDVEAAYAQAREPNTPYYENVLAPHSAYLSECVQTTQEGETVKRSEKNNEKCKKKKFKFLDGTWDDYDFGINDGGKEYPEKKNTKKLFLSHIGVSDKHRINRDGVYSSHLIGDSPEKSAKIIFLDTRFNRDQYYFKGMGGCGWKLGGLFSAVVRCFSAYFGFGHNYAGDVLGEPQWAWLEKELTYPEVKNIDKNNKNNETNNEKNNEKTDEKTNEKSKEKLSDKPPLVHILVSSIQVTATNSKVESWGHFPQARERLFALLEKTAPAGLTVLSGDVHHAQVLGDYEKGGVEVTSSGMSHSLYSEPLSFSPIDHAFALVVFLEHYVSTISVFLISSLHKLVTTGMNYCSCLQPLLSPIAKFLPEEGELLHEKNPKQLTNTLFLGRNFGTLEFDFDKKDHIYINTAIRDAKSGTPQIQFTQKFPKKYNPQFNKKHIRQLITTPPLIPARPWWAMWLRLSFLTLVLSLSFQVLFILSYILFKPKTNKVKTK